MSNYENLSDEELQSKLDETILKADPNKLSDEELERRLQLAEEKQGVGPQERSVKDQLIEGGLATIAPATSIGGAALGSALGTPIVGGVAGGSAGWAVGKYLEDIIRNYALGQPEELEKRKAAPWTTAGVDLATGAAMEAGGQIIGKTLKHPGLFGGVKKVHTPEIEASAEALGIEPTRGMIEEGKQISKLEKSLEESPTIGGALMRQKTEPVREGIKEATENIFKFSKDVPQSTYGQAAKEQLSSDIKSYIEPLQQTYEKIRESTAFIPLSEKSKFAVSNNIRNITKLTSSPAYPLLNKIADDVRVLQTADEIKQLRSMVGKMRENRMIDPAVAGPLDAVYGKLAKMEQASIMREAIKQARERVYNFDIPLAAKEGAEVGLGIVSELKQANKAYAKNIGELKDISRSTKLKANLKHTDQFLSLLEQLPDEQVVDKLFTANNSKNLENMAKYSPLSFDVLKRGYLNSLYEKATVDRVTNPRLIVNELGTLSPKAQMLILGKDGAEMIGHLRTVVESLPQTFNTSGTAAALEFSQILNPITQLSRLAQYGAYSSPNLGKMFDVFSKPGVGKASQFGAETMFNYMTSPRVPKEEQIRLIDGQPSAIGPQSSVQQKTITIADMAAQMGQNPEIILQEQKQKIEDSQLTNIEKAKRLNILSKGIIQLA